MKHILLLITILSFFGCKKEKIQPIDKTSLVGKIKATIFQNNKYEYIYNDTTGNLKKVLYITPLDTSIVFSFDYVNDRIYIYTEPNSANDYFDLKINQAGLINSFKSWDGMDSKNYYTVNYTNKLNSFTDGIENPFFGAGKYYNFKIEDGNYVSFVHQYIPIFGGLNRDTFNIAFTNNLYNKYAPNQKLFVSADLIFDFLGFNNNYLFPQNKNLIKSIESVGKYIISFEYEFNTLNQLVKMKMISSLGETEYTLEYY